MTSTLKLYKSCMIREEKLFIVDDIEDYLSTLTSEEIKKFQYQRQRLTLTIKIDKSQEHLEFTAANDYNYASIKNGTGKIIYYFIKNKKQIASSTIELDLVMDTINTLKPTTDFIVSNKTKINRQHKDRFSAVATYYTIGAKPWSDNPSTYQDGEYTYPEIFSEFFSDISEKGKMVLFDLSTPRDGWLIYGLEVSNISYPLKMYKVPKRNIAYQTLLGAGNSIRIQYNEAYLYDLQDSMTALFPTSDAGEYYLGIMLDSNSDDIDAVDTPPSDFYGDAYMACIGTLEQESECKRLIDFPSEGINPILYGEDKRIIQEDRQSWYLVYLGDSPLRCYLCADNPFSVKIAASDYDVDYSDLTASTYYYILPDENGNNIPIKTQEGIDVSAKITEEYNLDTGFRYRQMTITYYYQDGTNVKVGQYVYDDSAGLGWMFRKSIKEITTTHLLFDTNVAKISYHEYNQKTTSLSTIRSSAAGQYTNGLTEYTIYPLSTIDRTDDKLFKIIRLPYRPADSKFTGWQYDSTTHMLYLSNLDGDLSSNIYSYYNPLNELKQKITPHATDLKSIDNEPKLFHSDYYQPKFVYDSFSFTFMLERVNLDTYSDTDELRIIFTASNTFNSRFLFTFPSYNVNGKMTEDFSNICYAARNNDMPIYNSAYISYIKNGFNYDVKNKQRQEAGQWVGTAVSLVGAVASFASSAVTNGFGIAAGVSLATASLGQLVNAVNTTAQAEATQQQKLLQLREQKASVYGADDVDIMKKYCGDKAKMMLYQCSARMKSVLYDLFFYTGYTDGTNGIPNVTTRTRFNFLSCDLVLNEDHNIKSDILDDIKAKYALGVTFIHHYAGGWDFLQAYENWETALI